MNIKMSCKFNPGHFISIHLKNQFEVTKKNINMHHSKINSKQQDTNKETHTSKRITV